MNLNGFWELVESTDPAASAAERADALVERLAQLPLDEVLEFQLRLDEVRAPLDTMATLEIAALVLRGRVSDDGLWYFHAWLIGLGRAAHELAVHDPDALADHPAFRRLAALPYREWTDADFPDWEDVDYCAERAWEAQTGEEEGLEEALLALDHDSPVNAEPEGPNWTRAEVAARLPRLTALFADAA
ncbi:DUF4240 domain-containing protein [Kitasatospora sp. NPDC059646]|uniref:DUF4240 domain-containing protein n=1 Tax=Kitasatospora sp. NPDC059646 TaxID=3346893 RepID=UPI0036C8F19D